MSREIERLNEGEIERETHFKDSWHHAYQSSPYIVVTGLVPELTE
ncbi:hypothetical protein KIPB_015582, partial [Kipferlia bialata]|eukprot:g15582.t1